MRPNPEVFIKFHERAPRICLPAVQCHEQRGVVWITVIGHRDTLHVSRFASSEVKLRANVAGHSTR
jgi:hypothetical protein